MWAKLKRLNESLQTPFYVYDLERIRQNADAFVKLSSGAVRVLFATMANPKPEIVTAARESGLGAFVNSVSHLRVALSCGVTAENILFAGSGHGRHQLAEIAQSGVAYCADSPGQLAAYMSCNPKGAVGLRVNVGSLLSVDEEHDPAPRLGMTTEEVALALRQYSNVSILHVYVGTNIKDAAIYRDTIKALVSIASQNPQITDVDLGGGYPTAPTDTAHSSLWQQVLDVWHGVQSNTLRLTIEPGRAVVKDAGRLFTTVTDVKQRSGKRYVIVDTSGIWYPRHLLYRAVDHEVAVLPNRAQVASDTTTTICGSSTYSGDILATVPLPTVEAGDILEFKTAGAYCESMHLDFLGMDTPKIYCLDGGQLMEIERGIDREPFFAPASKVPCETGFVL